MNNWKPDYTIKGKPAQDVLVKCAEGDVILLAYWDGTYFWHDDEIVPDVYEWKEISE